MAASAPVAALPAIPSAWWTPARRWGIAIAAVLVATGVAAGALVYYFYHSNSLSPGLTPSAHTPFAEVTVTNTSRTAPRGVVYTSDTLGFAFTVKAGATVTYPVTWEIGTTGDGHSWQVVATNQTGSSYSWTPTLALFLSPFYVRVKDSHNEFTASAALDCRPFVGFGTPSATTWNLHQTVTLPWTCSAWDLVKDTAWSLDRQPSTAADAAWVAVPNLTVQQNTLSFGADTTGQFNLRLRSVHLSPEDVMGVAPFVLIIQ